jgi:hypothetical protein
MSAQGVLVRLFQCWGSRSESCRNQIPPLSDPDSNLVGSVSQSFRIQIRILSDPYPNLIGSRSESWSNPDPILVWTRSHPCRIQLRILLDPYPNLIGSRSESWSNPDSNMIGSRSESGQILSASARIQIRLWSDTHLSMLCINTLLRKSDPNPVKMDRILQQWG